MALLKSILTLGIICAMADIFTNVGEQWLCDKFSGVVSTVQDWVGWGTDSTTAVKGNTTLGTESAETRIQGTATTEGTGASAVYQVVATIVSLGAQTIAEAALFTAVTSGTMAIRGDFTGIVLATDDSIEFTFTLAPS